MTSPAAPTPPTLIPSPFTVVIDTREKAPYPFSAGLAVPRKRGRQYEVRTVAGTLPSGDYSLAGYERRVAVERKSAADLFGTLGGRKGLRRARFIREMERLDGYDFAAVVVEAEWSEMLCSPPSRSRMLPKTVLLSVLAFQQRYPRIHWLTVPGRSAAEAVVIRVLDRWWRDEQERQREAGVIAAERVIAEFWGADV